MIWCTFNANFLSLSVSRLSQDSKVYIPYLFNSLYIFSPLFHLFSFSFGWLIHLLTEERKYRNLRLTRSSKLFDCLMRLLKRMEVQRQCCSIGWNRRQIKYVVGSICRISDTKGQWEVAHVEYVWSGKDGAGRAHWLCTEGGKQTTVSRFVQEGGTTLKSSSASIKDCRTMEASDVVLLCKRLHAEWNER